MTVGCSKYTRTEDSEYITPPPEKPLYEAVPDTVVETHDITKVIGSLEANIKNTLTKEHNQ